MPTTRAAAKLKIDEANEEVSALKAALSKEKAKRIAAESLTKTVSLQSERKLLILQKELDIEKSWRINAQDSLKAVLEKMPCHDPKNSTADEIEKNVKMDAVAVTEWETTAEANIDSLDSKSKIEILRREAEIERLWRTTCQENLNSLIKRLPYHFVEKSTINEVHLPFELNTAKSMEEGYVTRTDKMNENGVALSESIEQANKEIEKLKHMCSTLSEKYKHLKSVHESELAVYEELRNWVESDNLCQSSSFKEFRSEDIDELLKDQQLIGSGGFGNVYKAVNDNDSVAVKVLIGNGVQGSREFHTEVDILRKIHHPNIVHLVGTCIDRKALIYEYLENGTLDGLLKDKTKSWFTWNPRIDVALKICSALIFLHGIRPMPVVHGDLKPENIMFNSLNVPKIGDFGISHELNCITSTGTWEHLTKRIPRGSSSYIDPEFADTCKLTPFADVYAFGVILLQLVTGEHSSGLINLVRIKMDALPNLKGKVKRLQKKMLEKTGLVEARALDTCDPRAALLVLQLGLDCTKSNSRQRPSLSASVWPKLCMIKMHCESSCTGQ